MPEPEPVNSYDLDWNRQQAESEKSRAVRIAERIIMVGPDLYFWTELDGKLHGPFSKRRIVREVEEALEREDAQRVECSEHCPGCDTSCRVFFECEGIFGE